MTDAFSNNVADLLLIIIALVIVALGVNGLIGLYRICAEIWKEARDARVRWWWL